jgi:hypothetical protein
MDASDAYGPIFAYLFPRFASSGHVHDISHSDGQKPVVLLFSVSTLLSGHLSDRDTFSAARFMRNILPYASFA